MAIDENRAKDVGGVVGKCRALVSPETCSRLILRGHAHLATSAAIALLIVIAASCRTKRDAPAPAAASHSVAFAYRERIGWFQGPCLAISNQKVAPGTTVTLIVMEEPQKVLEAQSLGQSADPKICKALLQRRAAMNATPGVIFYALEAGSVESSDIGIGIVSAPASLTVVNGLAQADLNHDGHREVFSSCSTTEGIKFAVWTDKAYEGEPLWSGYEYMGYDLQPTCP